MRGKLLSGASRKQLHGITPADAGKTHGYGQTRRRGQDHPRGCGENPVLHDFRAVSTGSPPRMRGKPTLNARYAGTVGITPADAGKTERQFASEPVVAGSPPRMRGKRCVFKFGGMCDRITPADAGKTSISCLVPP